MPRFYLTIILKLLIPPQAFPNDEYLDPISGFVTEGGTITEKDAAASEKWKMKGTKNVKEDWKVRVRLRTKSHVDDKIDDSKHRSDSGRGEIGVLMTKTVELPHLLDLDGEVRGRTCKDKSFPAIPFCRFPGQWIPFYPVICIFAFHLACPRPARELPPLVV